VQIYETVYTKKYKQPFFFAFLMGSKFLNQPAERMIIPLFMIDWQERFVKLITE